MQPATLKIMDSPPEEAHICKIPYIKETANKLRQQSSAHNGILLIYLVKLPISNTLEIEAVTLGNNKAVNFLPQNDWIVTISDEETGDQPRSFSSHNSFISTPQPSPSQSNNLINIHQQLTVFILKRSRPWLDTTITNNII